VAEGTSIDYSFNTSIDYSNIKKNMVGQAGELVHEWTLIATN